MQVSAVEKLRVATQLRSAMEIAFAHWADLPNFEFETEFGRWIDAIAIIDDRREFSLATMKWLATLQNGHTAFMTVGSGGPKANPQALR